MTELAWLYNMNRGIFMTPGREEEWTLSVTHTDEAVDAYVRRSTRWRRAHRLTAASPPSAPQSAARRHARHHPNS